MIVLSSLLMDRSVLLLSLILLFVVLTIVSAGPSIKLGIVYAQGGDYDNAWLGYTFYAHKINANGGLVVGPIGNQTNYTIELVRHYDNDFNDPYWENSGSGIGYTGTGLNKQWVWTNDREGSPSEQDRHWWQLHRLWEEDEVNFILGGSSSVSINETMTTSEQNIINMLCCVGPDVTYNQPFPNPTVFGVQCSNTRYTQDLILTLSIPEDGARKIAITYADNLFTRTTCEAAYRYATIQAVNTYEVVVNTMYPNIWEIQNGLNGSFNPVYDPFSETYVNMDSIIAEVAAAEPDLWIHCGLTKSGIYATKKLNALKFRPKASLLTVAPNKIESYYNAVGALSEYQFAVGQWHGAMGFYDRFFGSASQYSLDFHAFTGSAAEYVGAGAATAGYILGLAIQNCYMNTMHSTGIFSTSCIVNSLKQTNEQTFFGDVQFNAFNRNIAKKSATMQNLPNTDGTTPAINQACVLPSEFANAVIFYPDPVTIDSEDMTNKNIISPEEIALRVIASLFGFIIGLVLCYSLYKRIIVARKYFNLPIHMALIQGKKEIVILKLLASSAKYTVDERVDGCTALDIALKDEIFRINTTTEEVIFQLFCLIFDPVVEQYVPDVISLSALKDHKMFAWGKLAIKRENKAVNVVRRLLLRYISKVKLFHTLVEENNGHLVVDIASPEIQYEILKTLWIFGRYEPREGIPQHISESSIVVFAVDHAFDSDIQTITPFNANTTDIKNIPDLPHPGHITCIKSISSAKEHRHVALKFMNNCDQLICEINGRKNLSGSDNKYIVDILRMHESDSKHTSTTAAISTSVINNRNKNNATENINLNNQSYISMPYCIVMEAGQTTLRRIIDESDIAGKNWNEIKNIIKQITEGVAYLHSKNIIHGDLKPSNIIKIGNKIKIIDLDACANIGQKLGQKLSTGFMPPEMIWCSSLDNTYNGRSCWVDGNGDKIPEGGYELLDASPGVDLWSLGVIMYFMCTGSPIFQCDVAGDVFRTHDLGLLYDWSNDTMNDILIKVKNRYAKNFISLLLQKKSIDRLCANKMISHTFITNLKNNSNRIKGEKALYDVYLSYRGNSDFEHAQKIYNALINKGLKIWFDDSRCMIPTTEEESIEKKWEKNNFNALLNSDNYICIMSRDAINSELNKNNNFNYLDINSNIDIYFLDILMALELENREYISGICPIMIGDATDTPGVYGDYITSHCHPVDARRIQVRSIENTFQNILQKQGLGHSFLQDDERTVRSVTHAVTRYQGICIKGDWDIAIADFVKNIVAKCTKHYRVNNRQSAVKDIHPNDTTSRSSSISDLPVARTLAASPTPLFPIRSLHGVTDIKHEQTDIGLLSSVASNRRARKVSPYNRENKGM